MSGPLPSIDAGEEYVAPPVENSIPLPVPAPATCCLGPSITLPPMEEIAEEPAFICEDLDGLLREADEERARELQEGLLAQWYVLHLELDLRNGGDSMGSIVCVQGQAEGIREQLVLVPISEGIPQDVLESFGIQESQEGLHLTPAWEQSTPLFSGEMREFLPACLEDLDWSSRERSLSGRLVQSLVSGFAIHLRIGLSEEEGDAFLGALGVDRMEDAPVVKMEGDMEVVDAKFECRD